MQDHHPDMTIEVLKATPALTVGGLTLFGVTLSDIVLLASLILIVLQIVFLIWDKLFRGKDHGSKR